MDITKVELKDVEEKWNEKYPVIMKWIPSTHPDKWCTVLFVDEKSGLIIERGKDYTYPIGEFREDFIDTSDKRWTYVSKSEAYVIRNGENE